MRQLKAIKCPNHRWKPDEMGCLVNSLCNGLVLQDFNQQFAFCPKCHVFYAIYRDENNLLHLEKIDKKSLEFIWEPFVFRP